MNIKEKLQKKFGNKKHLKGHPRRKKKKNNNKLQHLTKTERKIKSCIERINKLIEQIEDEDIKEDSSVYVDDIINEDLHNLNKYDVTTKAILKAILEDPNYFFDTIFFTDDSVYLYSIKNLNCLKNYLTYNGVKYILSIFKYIESIYINKDYENIEESEEEFEGDPYKILELEQSEKITKKDIIKAYRKLAIKYHPDKHVDEEDEENKDENKKKYTELFQQINKAYKYLLKQIAPN